jgi:hypothetical protein
MAVTCPAGHTSESTDYCDTCGAAIAGAPAGEATPDPAAAGTAQIEAVGSLAACPNCGAPASVDDALCEVCGIDFATGELPAKPPAPPPAAPASGDSPPSGPSTATPTGQWVVVVEVDVLFCRP